MPNKGVTMTLTEVLNGRSRFLLWILVAVGGILVFRGLGKGCLSVASWE